MKVFCGTPTHGSPRIEYVTGFVLMRDHEMLKPPGQGHWVSSNFECGPYIGRNRNELVAKMYERDCEALMMMDHDVYAPPDTMEKMVAAMEATGIGIVAGDLILGDKANTGYRDLEDGTLRYESLARPVDPKTGKPAVTALVPCAATSTILIHRRVFDAISAHEDRPPFFGPGTWFMHWPEWDAEVGRWREIGEDFSFAKRARAVGEVALMHYELGLQHHKVGKMTQAHLTLAEAVAATIAKAVE